ncbi:ubiE/COQ5 methyltransferase family-domain-containing protein [Chytridium lagenaria]|nr:ubiE/COQ5 methyltransferase family-domain-containing protein [Chytridium lagenaria]
MHRMQRPACRLLQVSGARLFHAARRCLDSEKTTHFGFKTVAEEAKEAMVFRNVADKYDVMNDFMSAGVHRLWKDHFVRKLSPGPTTKLLDVAGGTAAYGPSHQASVQVVDINPAMLEVGRRRASTLGYLSKNCTHIDMVIKEAYRVLKPGGRFMVLDFYDLYSFNVIPALGGIVANDRESYQYLVESIRRFPQQRDFARMIEEAGFSLSGQGWEDLTFGVAAIHSGFKL